MQNEEMQQPTGMPMTSCTSMNTIKQDETMISQEEGCGAYVQDHFKNKLSIDERLAAQQEARQ